MLICTVGFGHLPKIKPLELVQLLSLNGLVAHAHCIYCSKMSFVVVCANGLFCVLYVYICFKILIYFYYFSKCVRTKCMCCFASAFVNRNNCSVADFSMTIGHCLMTPIAVASIKVRAGMYNIHVYVCMCVHTHRSKPNL